MSNDIHHGGHTPPPVRAWFELPPTRPVDALALAPDASPSWIASGVVAAMGLVALVWSRSVWVLAAVAAALAVTSWLRARELRDHLAPELDAQLAAGACDVVVSVSRERGELLAPSPALLRIRNGSVVLVGTLGPVPLSKVRRRRSLLGAQLLEVAGHTVRVTALHRFDPAALVSSPVDSLLADAMDHLSRTSPAAPRPGWYPDPTAPGELRWWDGGAWTSHRQVRRSG